MLFVFGVRDILKEIKYGKTHSNPYQPFNFLENDLVVFSNCIAYKLCLVHTCSSFMNRMRLMEGILMKGTIIIHVNLFISLKAIYPQYSNNQLTERYLNAHKSSYS